MDRTNATKLPSGVVTFVFTDIEGSTRLGQVLGAAFAGVLAQHHAILDSCVDGHDGVMVSDTGDGILAAFARASDAVAATVDMQQQLTATTWPQGVDVMVRVGMHTGVVRPVDGAYRSVVVHHAARVMDAGHGGQILLTSATLKAAAPLPGGVTAIRLGSFQLRDFSEAADLFQLCADGLADDFPRLRTPAADGAGIDPDSTALFGRDQLLADIIVSTRPGTAVTLVGTAGVGKTRLALRAASRLAGAWARDTIVVDLTRCTEPADVLPLVASGLGVRAISADSTAEVIVAALGRSAKLLVLDNSEHVLDAVADLVRRILRDAPASGCLLTSRSPLGIAGETIRSVSPLPPPATDASPAELRANPAVRLLLDRAARTGVTLDTDDPGLTDLANVVRALDGVPLALELAAARTQLFAPAELVDLLLADPGNRTDSLSAAIAWSYELCRRPEQRLLERMSVFPAGAELATLIRVCGDDSLGSADVADAAAGLVSKNLVVATNVGGVRRFSLLQSVRAFAADRLEATESEGTRARLRGWVADWTSRKPGEPVNAQRRRLEAEHAVIVEVIRLATQDTPMDAARLVSAVAWHWQARGDLALILEITASLLAGELPSAVVVPVCLARASALLNAGRYQEGLALCECWIDVARDANRPDLVLRLQVHVLRAMTQLGKLPTSPPDLAAAAADHSLDGETRGAAITGAMSLARTRGQWQEFHDYAQQWRALMIEEGDSVTAAQALQTIGHSRFFGGDMNAVLADYQQAHDELIDAGASAAYVGIAKGTIGSALFELGDFEGARVMSLASAEIIEACGLNPADPLLFLAGSLQELERYDEAVEVVARLIEPRRAENAVTELIEPLNLLTVIHIGRGDLDAALLVAEEAVELSRSDGVEPYKRGSSFLMRGTLRRLLGDPRGGLADVIVAWDLDCNRSPVHEIAAAAAYFGEPVLAARLFGWADSWAEENAAFLTFCRNDRQELEASLGPAYRDLAAAGAAATEDEIREWAGETLEVLKRRLSAAVEEPAG